MARSAHGSQSPFLLLPLKSLTALSVAQVWVKHLADGKSAAIALVNLGEQAAPVEITFVEAGLPSDVSQAKVRDLWKKEDMGTKSGSIAAQNVPSHASVFLKLTWD